jgi:malate dehydrogenase (oxaloacetate-decarboxylating)(NADP+)
MKPMFSAAKEERKRVIYAEGEDERVLRAAQTALQEGLAEPILIGRPHVIEMRLQRFGLRIRPGRDVAVVNPEDDPRYRDYVDLYFSLVGRRGVTPEAARTAVRTNTTVIGALAVRRGDADALLCGLEGRFVRHLRDVRNIIGQREGVRDLSTLSLLVTGRGPLFLTDSYVTADPSAEEIAEMTRLAADHISRFGIAPKAALLSASSFGSRDLPSARKMRDALDILRIEAPDLEADGEIHGDAALSETIRDRVMPGSRLTGEANLLVFPTLDAANIALNLVKVTTDALHVGPILLGAALPAHILTPSVTARGVLNMTAVAAVEAQERAGSQQPTLFG